MAQTWSHQSVGPQRPSDKDEPNAWGRCLELRRRWSPLLNLIALVIMLFSSYLILCLQMSSIAGICVSFHMKSRRQSNADGAQSQTRLSQYHPMQVQKAYVEPNLAPRFWLCSVALRTQTMPKLMLTRLRSTHAFLVFVPNV